MRFDDTALSILGEIGNISVGGAASSLSDFLDKTLVISIPNVRMLTFKEVKEQFEPAVLFAKVDFVEGMKGSNILLMKKEEAFQFSKIILKEKLSMEMTEWNQFSIDVLKEMINIMIGNMSSSMSDMFKRPIDIGVPQIIEQKASEVEFFVENEQLITIWFELRIENDFKFKFVKIMTEEQAQEMIKILEEEHNL